MQGLSFIARLAPFTMPAVLRRWLYRCRRASETMPLSRNFGWERGTPVDRLYIEEFLGANAGDITGRVLEIGDDAYSRRFGGKRVLHQDVLHVDPDAPGASLVGDLCDPAVLPTGAFDCIIITQTLHLLWDVHEGMRQLHRALAPGGTLLLTVPGISPVDPHEWNDCWYWSLHHASVKRLAAGHFGETGYRIETHGNLYAATAFLHGAVLEEIDIAEMRTADPLYPVVICARAVKHASGPA